MRVVVEARRIVMSCYWLYYGVELYSYKDAKIRASALSNHGVGREV